MLKIEWICFGYVLWICFGAISTLIVASWKVVEASFAQYSSSNKARRSPNAPQTPTLLFQPWSFGSGLPFHPTSTSLVSLYSPVDAQRSSFPSPSAFPLFLRLSPSHAHTQPKKNAPRFLGDDRKRSLFLLIIGRYGVSFMSYVMNGMYWWRWRGE